MNRLRQVGVAQHAYASTHEGIIATNNWSVPYLLFNAAGHGPYAHGAYAKEGFFGSSIDNATLLGLNADVDPQNETAVMKCPNSGAVVDSWPVWLSGYGPHVYIKPGGLRSGYQLGWSGTDSSNFVAFRLQELAVNPSHEAAYSDLIYDSGFNFHDDRWNMVFLDGHAQRIEDDGSLADRMVNFPPISSGNWYVAAMRVLRDQAIP